MEDIGTMDTPESTTSQEGTDAELEENASSSDAPQSEEENAADESSETNKKSETTKEPEKAFMSINYNHESKDLTKEEAVKLAQIGMKIKNSGREFDTLNSLYNKLDYIAAQRDCSVEEFVDSILSYDDEEHRNALLEKFGGDGPEINDLMQIYRQKQQEKYNSILNDRKSAKENEEKNRQISLETRLADEFVELKKEFPEVNNFLDLPKEVKVQAANGKDLLSSYLRYLHTQKKKIDAADLAEKSASRASTGSAATADATFNLVDSEFLKGIFGK